MDLRSAHKTPEKPPPRLRLSLTRSLVSEDEDQPYGDCRQEPEPEQAHRKSKPRRSQLKCLDSNPPSPSQDDWEDQEEDEEDEDNVDYEDNGEEEEELEFLKETTETSGVILNGKCVSRSGSSS